VSDNTTNQSNYKRVRIALKKLEAGDFDIGPLKKFGPFKN